jgi:hypothetical protein
VLRLVVDVLGGRGWLEQRPELVAVSVGATPWGAPTARRRTKKEAGVMTSVGVARHRRGRCRRGAAGAHRVASAVDVQSGSTSPEGVRSPEGGGRYR